MEHKSKIVINNLKEDYFADKDFIAIMRELSLLREICIITEPKERNCLEECKRRCNLDFLIVKSFNDKYIEDNEKAIFIQCELTPKKAWRMGDELIILDRNYPPQMEQGKQIFCPDWLSLYQYLVKKSALAVEVNQVAKMLINLANKTLINSYSPYSQFSVGAAILTKSGHLFSGTNVENVSYGATICAERSTIVKAVSEGKLQKGEIFAIAISAMSQINNKYSVAFPCGLCLQVIAEFSYHKINPLFFIQENNGSYDTYMMEELLPYSFKT